MKAVVVCCDRIPTRLIGCYGSEWVETPALDRLAAGGVAFDGFFAAKVEQGIVAEDVARIFSRRTNAPTIRCLSDRPMRTDADSVSIWKWESIARSPVNGVADVPLDRVLSDPYRKVPMVSHPDFKKWVERWRRQVARDDAENQAPDSCETLFASAAAAWDEHDEEDDLLLWVDVALADADWIPPKNWRDRIRPDVDSPPPLFDPVPGRIGEIYANHDVERVELGWANRLAYFDALLGAFFQSIEESSNEPPMLIFLAEQGEPLGEHGVVGPREDAYHIERIHLPLIIKHQVGPQSVRRIALTTLSDFAQMLCSSFEENVAQFSIRSDSERWFVRTELPGATSLTTHWRRLIVAGERVELYSRPDDALEMNDLSNRAAAEVEELCAALQNAND